MTHALHRLGLVSLLLACTSLATHADTWSEAQARYKDEMAQCNRLSASEDLKTCRLEARNALAEAKQHTLDTAPAAAFQSNQMQRCNAHTGEDRAACEARMRGEGRTEGSVTEGGILREIVRPVTSP